jgi:hypothetical protein
MVHIKAKTVTSYALNALINKEREIVRINHCINKMWKKKEISTQK